MNIVIGNTPYVKKDPEKETTFLNNKKIFRIRDRRKNSFDRRKSNRDGVFLTLSILSDRRVKVDRRRA